MGERRHYRGHDTDSRRWDRFAFREGDVVVATPSKCGTTLTQYLCALLVFDGPDLPAPLGDLSPWLDMRTRDLDDVLAGLAAQDHRRIVKTHTPLDGLPLDDRATYVCVGRDPRGVLVSHLHHQRNMDRHRLAELLAAHGDGAATDPASFAPGTFGPLTEQELLDVIDQRFRAWVEAPYDPGSTDEPLAALLHHFGQAWAHRHDGNVVVLHFADLVADRAAELHRLAGRLGIDLTAARAEELAAHADLGAMRDRADDLVPLSTERLWHDPVRFFRTGGVGEWADAIDDALQARYVDRVAELVPSEVAAWAHGGRRAADPDV